MTIKTIQPEELKFYWPEIKNGLERVLQKTPTATWIPEEVFSAIFTKRAVCVIGFINDEIDWGFVGLPLQDRVFFVWTGWSNINTSQGFRAIDDVAKQLGCHRIKFETDRRGWERVAKQYGYKPSTWVKEI